MALLAEHGSDWTLQKLDGEEDVVDWMPPDAILRAPKLSLFIDRGVYRPGEPPYVKRYAHQQTPGRSHPSVRRRVKVSLTSYGIGPSRELESRQVATNEYGAFSAKFDVPMGDTRGEVNVVTELGGRKVSAPVVVSAFREQEFEVAVTSSQPSATQDGAEFLISGKYHRPAPPAPVHWRQFRLLGEWAALGLAHGLRSLGPPPVPEGWDHPRRTPPRRHATLS